MMSFLTYKNIISIDPRYIDLNFKPDGREHYVYRITDLDRTEEQHYIGSHTPRHNKAYGSLTEEFWTYKTSSKYNTLDSSNKDRYKLKILKIFDNPADKILYEAYLHKIYDVKSSIYFWNRSNQTPYGFDTTGFSNYTEEELERRSKNAIQMNKDKQFREAQAKSQSTETSLANKSNTMKQKWGDDEYRSKMSYIHKERANRPENIKMAQERFGGLNNHKCNIIYIYDKENNLRYISDKSIRTFCKENNLPSNAIEMSYKTNKSLYENISKQVESVLINNGNIKYKGWYAIKQQP